MILLNILFVLRLTVQLAKPNIISHEEFSNITVSGITLEQIASTNGDETAVNRLYDRVEHQVLTSKAAEENIGNPVKSGSFYVLDKKVRIGFSSNLNVEGGLTKLEVLSSEVLVTICGIKIRLGDSSEKLSKFHKNDSYQNFLFIPQSDEDRVFSIRYDKESKLITAILFFLTT